MKKYYKIIVLALIFCLCFSSAAFAAGEGQVGTSEKLEEVFRCGQLPFAPGHEFQLVTLDDVAWRSGEYSGTPTQEKISSKYPHFDTPAETPLLVLVLEFNNISYKDDYDWGNTIFQGQYSLSQYYKDMSFNQFAFVPAKETSAYNVGGNHNTKDKVNDGVVHITVNRDHGCWDLEDETEDAKWIQCLVDGIKQADAYVDFSSFDSNGDGEITTDEMALGVIVAGYEAAADGSLTQGANYYLWSHAWNIYSAWHYYFQNEYPDWEDFIPCPDGVYVDSYIAIAEQLQKNRQEPISVLAHELGHYLGLPDLYNTSYNSGTWSTYDVSDLSVMCSGSWGWNNIINDYMPVAFDAWSRCCLGWVEPETVAYGVHDVVSDKGTEYNVLRVETGVSGDYYLLENREISGWDQGLYSTYHSYASNGGLVCWHIDDNIYNTYAAYNSVNNPGHRPAVMPLYPEKSNNKITFIGTLNSDGLKRPFFTYDIWNSYYASTLDCVDFPTYNGSNSYNGRTFSGVQMRILQAPNSHTVRVDFGSCEHDLVATPAREATCVVPGNSAYWYCMNCGLYFSDAQGTNEIPEGSWVIPALGHDLTATPEKEATCVLPGNSAYWYCSRCNKYFSDAECENEIPKDSWIIAPLGHSLEATPAHDATCTEAGNSAYWTCTRCGLYFADAYGNEEILKDSWVIAPFGHNLTAVPAKDPTCTEPGNTPYWTCTQCGLYFSDAQGNNEIAEDSWVIPAAGHDWDTENVVFNWTEIATGYRAEAVFTCKTDSTHTATIPATITFEINGDTITYTATVVFEGNTYTDQKTADYVAPFHLRVKGSNRYDTAIQAANYMKEDNGVDKFYTLVVAYGGNFADALSGSYLAAVAEAPILLVHPAYEQKVFSYISENAAPGAKIYLLGGKGAVSEEFEALLTDYNVERLGGKNRYATNLLVLEAANKIDGTSKNEVLLCSGTNFADALSTSSVGKPILLVSGDAMSEMQGDYLVESGVDTAWIIGGKGAVSEAIEEQLKNYIPADQISRVKGANRYETSYAVAKEFFGGNCRTAVIVYGQDFPDGLSGGAVASVIGSPVLLAMNNDKMIASVAPWVAESGATSSVTFGGVTLISDDSVRTIMNQPEAEIILFE